MAEYLVSLARLREFAPTYVYGGHGEPVTDFEEIFHRYVRMIDERQSKIMSLMNKNGITAWDMAINLFPQVMHDDTQKFLAISEAVAHLDYAESEGKIAVELRTGTEVYRLK